MDVPTQTHLKTLRQGLEFRLAELRAEIHAAELVRRSPLDMTDVDDRKDEALRVQAAEVGEAEEQRDVDELQAVVAALDRLEAGRYGDCADCGEPIGLERLRVQPAAERCAHCQQAHEHRSPR
jgi:RNA polymerase-binding transcription factor DksA